MVCRKSRPYRQANKFFTEKGDKKEGFIDICRACASTAATTIASTRWLEGIGLITLGAASAGFGHALTITATATLTLVTAISLKHLYNIARDVRRAHNSGEEYSSKAIARNVAYHIHCIVTNIIDESTILFKPSWATPSLIFSLGAASGVLGMGKLLLKKYNEEQNEINPIIVASA